ncbi:MAG: hypothetical protein ACKVOK_00595 [Flavobacteriales bacterium]
MEKKIVPKLPAGTFQAMTVADCFAKTIEPKIAEAINIWEIRLEKWVIASDQEAVA